MENTYFKQKEDFPNVSNLTNSVNLWGFLKERLQSFINVSNS